MSLFNDFDKKWVSLLFVQDGARRRVVEVPFGMANVGDLVEYIVPEREEPEAGFTDTIIGTRLGLVLKKMDCERFGNEWSCVSELTQIRSGKTVFHPGWSRSEEKT